jgi:hypothetical protein
MAGGVLRRSSFRFGVRRFGIRKLAVPDPGSSVAIGNFARSRLGDRVKSIDWEVLISMVGSMRWRVDIIEKEATKMNVRHSQVNG